MKKYLFLAVAALGFAACAEKGLDNNSPEQSGEIEKSYVAITLAADDMGTKGATDVYEKGTEAERAVKSAYVFFFKDGKAFPVKLTDGTSENTGTNNYLQVTLNTTSEAMPNVSDVKDAVLVLQNYKGEYPNQIVALLNWDPTGKNSYTLSELQTKISELGNDTDGYVMSNSVYAANSKVVDAVDLKIENIFKTESEAKNNPVTIHVERVAAKVVFTADNSGKFLVGKEVDNTPVYAQITGFELFNDYQKSWLIKRIDAAWDGIGFSWNEPDWFRSYWARSLKTEFESNEFAFDDDNKELDQWVYCGENTDRTEEDRTKVIIKAKLVKSDGTPIEVVNWYGKDYVNEEKLLDVVANTLKNTYYFSPDGVTYEGILPSDLKCTTRKVTDPKAYEVYFQLSETGDDKNWYNKNDDGTFTKYADVTAFNDVLAAIQPALVYKDGQTYYYTDIKHFGNEGSTTEYGVVRNHVYKVNITGISGYGTPMYDPSMEFITPEKPVDIKTFVSAQINVLSWRVVANDYELN